MSTAREPSARSGSEPRPSFETLYESWARTVHGIALAHVGRHDADDVVQEAFLQVHAKVDQVRDPAALGAWICEVARNAARSHLRRQRRRGAVPLEQIEPPSTSAEQGDHELAERVLAVVRRLPEAYRETLILRLVEGLGGPEIAERTGMTAGSVRVNLCRGMAMLRPELAKEGWP